jgi:hypothetical protein
MAQFDTFSSQTDRPLFAKVLILFGLTLVFLAVGSAIGLAVFSNMTGVPMAQFATFQANPNHYPDAWYAMMLLQALSTPIPFILSALVFGNTSKIRKSISGAFASLRRWSGFWCSY